MTSIKCIESMAYGFRKTGQQEQKVLQQKECSESTDLRDLSAAFNEWLVYLRETMRKNPFKNLSDNKLWEAAVSQAKDLNASFSSINAFLVMHESTSDFVDNAGIFASALYNKLEEKVLVFDFTIPGIDYIGYRVDDKTLVNLKSIGRLFGAYANSTVLNYGNAGSPLALGSKAVVDYGSAADSVGTLAGFVIELGNGGTVIGAQAYGPVIDFSGKAWFAGQGSSSFTIVPHQQKDLLLFAGVIRAVTTRVDGIICFSPEEYSRMPELQNYLLSLKRDFEAGRHDYNKAISAIERLGPEPGKRIHDDIANILLKYQNINTDLRTLLSQKEDIKCDIK